MMIDLPDSPADAPELMVQVNGINLGDGCDTALLSYGNLYTSIPLSAAETRAAWDAIRPAVERFKWLLDAATYKEEGS